MQSLQLALGTLQGFAAVSVIDSPLRALALAAAILGACRDRSPPPEGQLTIRTDRDRYHAGEQVVVEVHNRTGDTVWDPGCRVVEGYRPTFGWNATLGVMMDCDFIGRPEPPQRIVPGGVTRVALPTNRCAYAGRWRVRLSLEDAGGQPLPLERRVSEPFIIESPRLPDDPDPRATNDPCLGRRRARR